MKEGSINKKGIHLKTEEDEKEKKERETEVGIGAKSTAKKKKKKISIEHGDAINEDRGGEKSCVRGITQEDTNSETGSGSNNEISFKGGEEGWKKRKSY